MFISLNLINAIVDHSVVDVVEYFDIDHKAISVSVGLSELLNTHLNFVHKQVNRNCWKFDFKDTDEANIKSVINKRMESFETNKGYTIRSVLECTFCKVVLDYLVVGDEMILKPNMVKSKVNAIIEGWTKKHMLVKDIFDNWSNQYKLLEYIFNEAFSGVMHPIKFDELFGVIFNLPNGKVVGLLDIPNELWKHYGRSIMNMLLLFINFCLFHELVPSS
ncbi:hypothetical protein G9A89_013519 [Geosiphon pyriformis]|nr:hypothetical protein G9A89_013519 [Geosiphon pyriformis]